MSFRQELEKKIERYIDEFNRGDVASACSMNYTDDATSSFSRSLEEFAFTIALIDNYIPRHQ